MSILGLASVIVKPVYGHRVPDGRKGRRVNDSIRNWATVGDNILSFGGHRNFKRREAAEKGKLRLWGERFEAYRKVTPAYAIKVREPFQVHTLEGVMRGQEGDYLAVGPAGELYPIAADVFKSSYERI
jgi:hypothetical protein